MEEQGVIEVMKKIAEIKRAHEASITAMMWKDTENYYNFNLMPEEFNCPEWNTYYKIGHEIVLNEGKPVLDEITVGLYLEKHPELKKLYEKYGGFNTMENGVYIDNSNLEGYIGELKKWNAILELKKKGFPIDSARFEDFKIMDVEEVYEEYEGVLNHIFAQIESSDQVCDIADGLDDLIDELNSGMGIGLPLYNMPMLTEEIGGLSTGNITLVGGLSGVGKSSFVRSTMIPQVLETGEQLVIMINEEGKAKWQRELLVWVANNIFKCDIQKKTVRNGHYTPETMDILKKSAGWIEDRRDIIRLIPFKSYSTNLAIKQIRKYSSMGVKYFVLDTFKSDDNAGNQEAFWFALQQNMVKIYDTVKPDVKDVQITITFQLSKGSTRVRHYMQDNVGMAKNIIDVASTCLMVREVFDDEYEGGKKELQVYNFGGANKRSKIPVKLKQGKNYQVVFITKNREGGAGSFQIVIEHDLSRNVLKEVGITNVPQDF